MKQKVIGVIDLEIHRNLNYTLIVTDAEMLGIKRKGYKKLKMVLE